MKIVYHKGLTKKQWFLKSIFEQMANVGAEVERAINWKKKDRRYSQLALERALELLDLTIDDPKNKNRLKEIIRVREMLVDYFFENQYASTAKFWHQYFYPFNYATRLDL